VCHGSMDVNKCVMEAWREHICMELMKGDDNH